MGRAAAFLAACVAVAAVGAAPPSAAAPPSVVSIDYCADQYVLSLAARSQIRGLSPRAAQAFSYHRDRAVGLAKIEPVSEAILHAAPDAVVRFWGGNGRLLSMLDRTGVLTVNVVYGHDTETIFGNLERVAAALDRQEAAEELLADRRLRIAALAARPALDLRALYLTPSGTTGGAGTDVDDMIRMAGLENMAAGIGYKGWRTIAIEELVMDPPDVFIGSFFDDDDVARSSWSPSRHPQLAAMMERVRTVSVPGRFLSCSGLFSVDAAEYLRAALEAPE